MSKEIYKQLLLKISNNEKSNVETVITSQNKTSEVQIEKRIISEDSKSFTYSPVLKKEENSIKFFEPVGPKERLIILGGGHISKALCEFAATTGFQVWIADEREEFATKERFPKAYSTICEDFTQALEKLQIQESDYVAIVTRGHSCDGICLSYIFNHTMPYYLGMIGSKSRVGRQFDMFEKQGIPREKLNQVHHPIGLEINAATPEEIAVSILGELILEKRKQTEKKIIQTDMDNYLIEEIVNTNEEIVIVTLMESDGSTPRKAGAKMLIYPSGNILGSIGGGFVEKNAIEKAREIIGTGKTFSYEFKMDASVAATVGMACGGQVTILMEDLMI